MTERSPNQTSSRFKAILSVVFVVCVATMIGISAKSCSQNLSRQKSQPGNTTANIQQTDKWMPYTVAGLLVELPGPPQLTNMEMPQQVKDLTEKFEIYSIKQGTTTISVLHALYKVPEINIESSADGTLNQVKSQPKNTAFKSEKQATQLAGLNGWEIKMTYTNTGYTLAHYCAVFGQNNEMWQIQIVGLATSESTGLEELKNKVFGSVKFATRTP